MHSVLRWAAILTLFRAVTVIRAAVLVLIILVQLGVSGTIWAGVENSVSARQQVSALDLAKKARELTAQGEHTDALKAAKQALPLARSEYGVDHLYVAYLLDDLATYHFKLGHLADALGYSENALKIAGGQLNTNTLEYAALTSNHAAIIAALGRYRDAEVLYVQSYGVFYTQLGEENERTIRTARNLGITYLELSQYDKAEEYLRKAIAAGKSVYGDSDVVVGRLYVDIADVQLAREHIPQARKSADDARRIFAMQESTDIEDLVSAEVALAKADIQQSQLEAADRRLHSALNRLEAQGKHEELIAADVLYNIGFIMVLRGNAVEAEPVYNQVLLIYRGSVGPDHPAVGRVKHSMALVYRNLGQGDKADRMFTAATEIFTKNFGSVNTSVAATRTEHSLLLADQGKSKEAIIEARTALAIYRRLPDSRDIKRAYAMSALGFALYEHGDLERAAEKFRDATDLMITVRGESSSDLPPGLTRLGEIYLKQGRFSDAEESVSRAISILEKDKSMTAHGLARSLSVLAKVQLEKGRFEDSLAVARRYVAIMSNRLGVAQQSRSSDALGEQRKSRYLYEEFLEIARLHRAQTDKADEALLAEMLEVAQFPHLTDTAAAISRMAARFVPDQPALAGVVRKKQEAQEQWQAVTGLLTEQLGKSDPTSVGVVRLRKELAVLDKQIMSLDEQLMREFPRYSELTNPRPVSLNKIKSILGKGEALVLQVTGDQGTFVFLVRNDRLRFYKSGMSADRLQEAVSSLRAGLDIQSNRFSELPPFDTRSAYYLYENLLQPFEGDLNGIHHIVLVLDRAFQNLPPNVLLAEPAEKSPAKPRDFRKLEFLPKYYAFSVVPSVSAFTTLRLNAGANVGKKPFVGFGAPKLRGAVGSDTRGVGFEIIKQTVAETDPGNLLSKMAALPETEKELRAMAELLHAEGDVLYFNERANEARVKAMNLSNFNTIAFATHALMTGEFRGLAEPALVLTPPAKADEEDDGLLTTSEVARLELNSDWVVLSACNTASPEGKPGAEGLSGLAKAFFYAGARSLLVSHWWVASDSTVLLTTGTIEALAENPAIGRAEALRVSIAKLMGGEGAPEFSHPVFWAPFVLVGEGGSK